MKKVFKFLLFSFALFAFSGLFAQDSTAVDVVTGAGAEAVDLFSFLAQFIPVKYQAMVITVLTFLFLLEQYLANTTSLAANSTFQLVSGWIKAAYQALFGKKK